MLEVKQCSGPSGSSGSSGLACFSIYQKAVGDQVQKDEGDDNDNNTPSFKLEACANTLEVEWHGGPSVLSRSSGLACISDCL